MKKYNYYKVYFTENTELDFYGNTKNPNKDYAPINKGYIAILKGNNPEIYKNDIINFYKSVFYGERITGIMGFEQFDSKERKRLQEKYGCGFKLFSGWEK